MLLRPADLFVRKITFQTQHQQTVYVFSRHVKFDRVVQNVHKNPPGFSPCTFTRRRKQKYLKSNQPTVQKRRIQKCFFFFF